MDTKPAAEVFEHIRLHHDRNKERRDVFNDYCAEKIMGWERRANVYFRDDNVCIGDVSFYNPYEDEGELQAVLDVLRIKYGLVPVHSGRDLVWWFMQFGHECPRVDDDAVMIKGCVGKERFWEEDEAMNKEDDKSLNVVEAIRADYLKRQASESGDANPYEQAAILADQKDEENRRKEFNAKSAEIMGWSLGNDELIGDLYFDNFGNVVGHFQSWNPYDSMKQMQAVLNVAAEEYGVTITTPEALEKPALEMAREKIFAANLSPNVKDDVLDVEEGWDEHDRLQARLETIDGKPFTVESYPTGAAEHPVNNLEGTQVLRFNQFCAEITNSCHGVDYDPYNNLDQLEQAIAVIGDDLGAFVDEWLEAAHGRLVACRAIINEIMEDEDKDLTTDDDWDILGDDIGNDVHAACKKISDAIGSVVGTDSTYPNVKEEQDNFNAQCRKIMFKHSKNQGGSLMLTNSFDPYYNGTQLINVLEVVLQYVPNSIHLLMAGQRNVNEDDEDVTHGTDVTWHIRKFIESYGTDEWMTVPLSVEEKFNNMCKELCEGYKIMPTDENYNPYDYIGDLAPVLPVIIARTPEHPFKIPGVMIDNAIPREGRENIDMHDNMVFYVQCYGQDVLDMLETDDE